MTKEDERKHAINKLFDSGIITRKDAELIVDELIRIQEEKDLLKSTQSISKSLKRILKRIKRIE